MNFSIPFLYTAKVHFGLRPIALLECSTCSATRSLCFHFLE